MKITDVIAESQGGEAIANLARAYGLTEQQVTAVMEAALPTLVSGIERNTLSRGGLADLVRALGDGHHEQILERPDVYTNAQVRQDGQGILGHIMGSDSRVRGLAIQTARSTGISENIIQMLLPIIAQMIMGALSRWLKGGLGDIINKLPSDPRPGSGDQPGRTFPMPPLPEGGNPVPSPYGQSRRGGMGPGFELPTTERPTGGFPMPPIPGDTEPKPPQNPANELPLPHQLPPSRPQGGFPLPLPQEQPAGSNPYGDLSDILRRGGSISGSNPGSVIRDMIGNALGFKTKGVIGWIIRLLIVRFGWNLVKRMFGRAFAGR